MLQGIRPVFRFNVVIVSIYLIKRGENMFKKIITAVLATLMLLIVLPTKVLAEEEEPTRAPILPYTEYVNRTVSVPMMAGGCSETAYFRISGQYTVDPLNGPISPALNVTLVDYPKDWKVVYQYSDFVPNGTGISVTIHYYFLTTYFDCPIGAGPQYRAYTVGV